MNAPSVIEITALMRPVVQNLDGFLGAILMGSVSAGMQDETSDYDIQLVFDDEAFRAHAEYGEITLDAGGRKVDCWASSLSELRDMDPSGDEAKDYVNAVYLLDTSGAVKAAARSFVEIAPEKQHDYVAARLDSYYNALYRSLKCRRHGYMMGYYAMAVAAMQSFSDVVYAVNGTISPFINRVPFLLKRLDKLPAPAPVLAGMMENICADARVKMQIALFDLTSVWMAQIGYRHVQDAWEGVLEREVDNARTADYGENDCH